MIKFENIDLKFGNNKIFDKFSFEIKNEEKVIISGRSGLGKSTLFFLLLGFTKPDDGKIYFNDISVCSKSVWEIRKQISFIDQDVSLFSGKVSDKFNLVSSFKTNHSLDFKKEKIFELMDFFELENNLFEKNIFELSGGERQRIAIIISILLNRKVFLLDEVTSSLDKNLKKKVSDFFVNKKEATVIVISHDYVWTENPLIKTFNLEKRKWEQ